MRSHRPLCLIAFAAVLAGAVCQAAEPIRPLSSHAAAAPRASRDVSQLPDTPGCTVDPERELFIIDLDVVRDCYRTTWTGPCPAPVLPATRGAWTLGGLLKGVFGTNDPVQLSNLTKQWLGEWKVTKVINGDIVPARPDVQSLILDPWMAASGSTTLDMTKAPARLLAVVFRLDLRRSSGYSGGGSAGEARFVYNMLRGNGQDAGFTLILEYGLDAPTCADIQTWANRVHSLGSLPLGSPEYNAALQGVTDLFATIGASPGKPNGSAINQVRTNEVFLVPDWELREFKLKPPMVVKSSALPAPAPLLQVTLAQTPADEHDFQPIFADYVNANAAAIEADNYTVPLTFQGQGFRGGAVLNAIDIWDGPPPLCSSIASAQARHIASLNTCDGCHGGETGTFFRQVLLTGLGGGAMLTGFLTGMTITDECGLEHTFNDIERRRVDLCQLLQKSCSQIEEEQPVSFAH